MTLRRWVAHRLTLLAQWIDDWKPPSDSLENIEFLDALKREAVREMTVEYGRPDVAAQIEQCKPTLIRFEK